MKKIFLIFCLVIYVFAKDISVTGFGDNEIEAKKSALKELSTQIEVSLHSNITTTKSLNSSGDYGKDVTSTFNQVSTVKFLGLQWSEYSSLHKSIKLTLPTNSYALYAKRIREILEELSYYQDNVNKLKTDVTKLKFYKKSQSLIAEYNLLDKVTTYLRLDNMPKPKTSLKKLDIEISKSIDNLSIKPSVKLINDIFDNVIVDNKLSIDIRFKDLPKDDVVLHDKQSVVLVVKANRPSYYYITETIIDKLTNKITHSLLQLSEQTGEYKFIGKIGPDEIKSYVVLGEFEVGKPFGYSHLHIFASNKKIENLPQTKQNSDGLYIIQKDTSKNINDTRALFLKKKKKDKKLEIAENSLDFESRR